MLTTLLADQHTPLADVAELLEAADHATRWGYLSRLNRAQQRALYQKADPTAMDLDQLVPDSEPLAEVIHDGLNTLPVPSPLRRFEKRFCRPDDATVDDLFGYNEGSSRRIIGPGYFVAVSTEGRPEWRERGGVVVDYFRVPDAPVAPGWPRVVPNSRGLQRLVYDETRDFLRRVSAHVSIGAAYKRERALDHYFVLCRRA